MHVPELSQSAILVATIVAAGLRVVVHTRDCAIASQVAGKIAWDLVAASAFATPKATAISSAKRS
jgi:hypothetical protein